MRAAVLGFSFDGLGARVAETSAFLDNAASNAVSRDRIPPGLSPDA